MYSKVDVIEYTNREYYIIFDTTRLSKIIPLLLLFVYCKQIMYHPFYYAQSKQTQSVVTARPHVDDDVMYIRIRTPHV